MKQSDSYCQNLKKTKQDKVEETKLYLFFDKSFQNSTYDTYIST